MRRRHSRSADPGRDAEHAVPRALIKFALASVVALAVLTVIGGFALDRLSRAEAIDDARRATWLLAHSAVEPSLTNGILRDDPRARARIDRAVRRRVLVDSVVRVKLWAPDGRIVYSDEPRLIGTRFSLDDGERSALAGEGVQAEVSDLSGSENRFERGSGMLLEVYLSVQTPSGRRLLFETYQDLEEVTASARAIWTDFIPALIGVLIALQLTQLPLAWSLARRVQRAQRGREALLRRAIDASDIERRRIAADLHDGIVQELVAASYSLSVARDDAAAQPQSNGLVTALDRAARTCRGAVQQLRSLLVEIYPPRLREAGLGPALSDLAEPLAEKGTHVTVDVPAELPLSEEHAALFFRTAHEALRNVAAHADAGSVTVRVEVEDDRVRMTVADDGRGFTPAEWLSQDGNGHFGLRLTADLARDAGAGFEVDSATGIGTTIRLEAPAA